jgi:hypothetical protein
MDLGLILALFSMMISYIESLYIILILIFLFNWSHSTLKCRPRHHNKWIYHTISISSLLLILPLSSIATNLLELYGLKSLSCLTNFNTASSIN